jgi:hypothetical protein
MIQANVIDERAPATPGRPWRVTRAIGLYAALTVLGTWPMATQLRIVTPGDSAFFAWAVGWGVHAIKTDPLRLPHANIFHPAAYALGMDESVLGTTLLALPLAVFTDDAVLLFNLVRLLTYVLSAFGAYLLARELGTGEAASLAAGALFAFSPMRGELVGHLSALGTQWLPLVLLFLHRFARRGAVSDAALAGAFFALAGWACGYHGILGLLVLPPVALVLLWGRLGWIPRALPGVAIAALGLFPMYLMHRAAFEPYAFSRGREETILYSASLESFLAAGPWNLLYGELTTGFRSAGEGNLFPGLVVPGLILWCARNLWSRAERPGRAAIAFGALAAGAAVVALGPEVRWMGRTLFLGPYGYVRDALPLFQNIRVTARVSAYLALSLAVLAARALDRLRSRPRLAVAIFGLAMLEATFAPVPFAEWAQVVDTSKPLPAVYQWLREQPGEFAIVELPMKPDDGYFRQPAFDESIYMVWSTWHWKRLVNGYAGLDPPHHRKAFQLAQRFPSDAFLEHVRGLGTRYVVLHHRGFGPNKTARLERELPRFADQLRPVARFPEDTVFELMPRAAGPSGP